MQIEEYPDLLQLSRERLGTASWRLRLDIILFAPTTASIIAKRYPEAVEAFAREIAPEETISLSELARQAKGSKEHIKKIRLPTHLQA